MEAGYSGPETPRIPEKEHISPSPEFSRRILLGPKQKEVLNPNTKVAPVTRETLGTFAERDYVIYDTKSDEERDTFWQTQPEQEKETQMQAWLLDTQRFLEIAMHSSPRQKTVSNGQLFLNNLT